MSAFWHFTDPSRLLAVVAACWGITDIGLLLGQSPRSPSDLSQAQPRDDGVMAIKIPGNGPCRFPSLEPPAALRLLMLGQLRFSTELDTARPGGLPPILRPVHDPLALILRERA